MADLSDEDVRALRRQRFLGDAAAPLLHLFLLLAATFRFGYKWRDTAAFRRRVWDGLAGHDGPVILAANHLTLWDSFLIYFAIFPFRKCFLRGRLPWSTPEYANYYHNGGWLKNRAIRAFMYLGRCIPFVRGGEDEASVRWRADAFERCVWVLQSGGTVFVFPEATRSRSGWFDVHEPKDFLGRLALRVPNARFLVVYLRGESQVGTTDYPRARETFRMLGEVWSPDLGPESTPRSVSEELFRRIGVLQEEWFAAGSMLKNCSGNDVVDLGSPLARENFSEDLTEVDEEWLDRLLTQKEKAYVRSRPQADVFAITWRFHAAKEAVAKALAQAGVKVLPGGFTTIEADLFQGRARHLPTRLEAKLLFTGEGEDKVHCVAVLRGGTLGDEESGGDVLWRVERVPEGRAPSEHARDMCLALIAEASDDIPSPASLSFTEIDDVPRVTLRGKAQDWGVSLSHHGRFAACSFMVS